MIADATGKAIISGNPRRVAIAISTPAQVRVQISDSEIFDATHGFGYSTGFPPYQWHERDYGLWVKNPIYVFGLGAGGIVSYIETVEL